VQAIRRRLKALEEQLQRASQAPVRSPAGCCRQPRLAVSKYAEFQVAGRKSAGLPKKVGRGAQRIRPGNDGATRSLDGNTLAV